MRWNTALPAGAAVVAAALVAVAISGCRPTSSNDAIDPPALERQLERVSALQLHAAQFYGRTVRVACLGDGDDLHYRCHVSAGREGMKTQEWDVLVRCTPPPDDGTPRCYSDRGDALQ
jgi:hypothetical protein